MEKQDSLYLVRFLLRNFKTISISIVIAIILSLTLTFFQAPHYRSFAIVFPTSSISTESAIDNPNFGYDIEADRLLQLLQSYEIKDSVINKFHLIDYYKIDTSNIAWRDQLNKLYWQDITFERTIYMSIVIAASTEQPQMSADIVNYILKVLEDVRDRIYKSNIVSSAKVLKSEYEEQKTKLDTLLTEINNARKGPGGNHIVLTGQAQYSINFNNNGRENYNNTFLEQKVNQYHYEQGKLNDIYSKYERAIIQIKRPIPSVYVVDRAVPSYRKESPSYTKNLLVAIIGAFVISTSVLFLKEKFIEIKNDLLRT